MFTHKRYIYSIKHFMSLHQFHELALLHRLIVVYDLHPSAEFRFSGLAAMNAEDYELEMSHFAPVGATWLS